MTIREVSSLHGVSFVAVQKQCHTGRVRIRGVEYSAWDVRADGELQARWVLEPYGTEYTPPAPKPEPVRASPEPTQEAQKSVSPQIPHVETGTRQQAPIAPQMPRNLPQGDGHKLKELDLKHRILERQQKIENMKLDNEKTRELLKAEAVIEHEDRMIGYMRRFAEKIQELEIPNDYRRIIREAFKKLIAEIEHETQNSV